MCNVLKNHRRYEYFEQEEKFNINDTEILSNSCMIYLFVVLLNSFGTDLNFGNKYMLLDKMDNINNIIT
jgi:hypothetical protein